MDRNQPLQFSTLRTGSELKMEPSGLQTLVGFDVLVGHGGKAEVSQVKRGLIPTTEKQLATIVWPSPTRIVVF
jgi:hypothetical protein